MAAVLIKNSPGEPYHSIRTRLEGRDYILHFAYNQREARWYLSIHDDEDIALVQSIKLVTNWPLLRFYHHDPRVPPGDMMVIDQTNGDKAPPGLDDFGPGLRCELTYFTSDYTSQFVSVA